MNLQHNCERAAESFYQSFGHMKKPGTSIRKLLV